MPPKKQKWTRRELQIADMVSSEYSNKEMATELGVSLNTVNKHLFNLCQKIGCHSKVGIAVWHVMNPSDQ